MKSNFVVLLLVIIFGSIQNGLLEEIDADEFSKKFVNRYNEYLTTHIENEELNHLKNFLLGTHQKTIRLKGFPEKANGRNCLKCYSVVTTILSYNSTHGFEDPEGSKEFLKKLCNYAKIDSRRICDGNVELYYETLKYILKNRQSMTAEEVCGILLQGFYCAIKEKPYTGISVENPILIGSKRYLSKSKGQLKILHFSDFHYDPKYTAGSNAECEEWICCRGPELPLGDTRRTGKWGDYRHCDSPSYQVENLVIEAASRHKNVAAIYMTGDYANHFGWDKTSEELIHSLEYVTNLVKQQFPGVPVFPILGNHDSHPDDLFAPVMVKNLKLSTSWIYDFISNLWKDWLPEDALQTFRNGGYYTTLLRPNLRIIALNNNVCFSSNLWLLLDNFYFRDQLEWLNHVLSSASLANEKVHILSHVPSNDIHCYRIWTKEYKKIIERYTHVISAQFNGHSHLDEFVVYYAEQDSSVALNVAWNGGSGTNFPDVNSNYKVFYVNDETYDVMDFETWIFNLTEANAHSNHVPRWFKEYSFKSFFNLTDLSPNSIDYLVKTMASDEKLLEKYWRIKVKQSDHAFQSGCDSTCLADVWSSITRTCFDNAKNIGDFIENN